MLNRQWNALIIDDEPDVLAVTRLALKRITCYGLPVVLHEAQSKAEALKFFDENPESAQLAIAIVDVVMENDQAGLEFCEWLRKTANNHVTRIIVRTGQAGKAPERDVVDKYDITGYLAKTDAKEDKLYSTVKCCVKEYYETTMMARAGVIMGALAPATATVDSFNERLRAIITRLQSDPKGRKVPSQTPDIAVILDDNVVGRGGFENRDTALTTRDKVMKTQPTPLNDFGDAVYHADGTIVVSLAPLGKLPAMQAMWTTIVWPVPMFAINCLHSMFQGVRAAGTVARLKG